MGREGKGIRAEGNGNSHRIPPYMHAEGLQKGPLGQGQGTVKVHAVIICDARIPDLQKFGMGVIPNGGELLMHHSPHKTVFKFSEEEELLLTSFGQHLTSCQEHKAPQPPLVPG